MSNESELLAKNVELLKSTVNKQGIYGLIIAITTIVTTTLLVSYQMTGTISLASFIYVQNHNFALRILDFLPFIFTYWGQKAGYDIASHAGKLVVEQTDDLRAESTSWKQRSLHEATHDAQTGLPNRVMFYEKLRDEIASTAGTQKSVTILFLDLDSFKEINDTLGNANGDQILKYLATRLQRSVAGTDTLARMGGDEFALLLGTAAGFVTGIDVALRIQRILAEPFKVEGHQIEISASIGIAHCPAHARDVDALIQCAEIASHAAKRTIKGFVMYAPELKHENPRRLMLTGDLRKAIEDEYLELYYQPKVSFHKGEVVGAEALLRWNHPEYGFISPDEFTRIAERARLIRPLTNMVIQKSVRQLQAWHDAGLDINLSANISVRDLGDPELPDTIAGILANSHIDPARLTLEITESSIMDKPEQALPVINRLDDLKLHLSIDDFGTGYSSLAYLSKLPVHELKIDKSFVLGMRKNRSDHTIVKATIDLGHNLNMQVTAEGIEDQQTWETLKQIGCDLGQGYYMSPPLPESEFMKWLTDSRWKQKKAVTR